MPNKKTTGIKDLTKGKVSFKNPVVQIVIGGLVLAVIVFVIIYQVTKPKSGGPGFKAKACGPYAYCRATNQDDSSTFGSYNNVVRMNNVQFAGFQEWLKQTDRLANGSLEPQKGGRLEAYAQGRPFTDGEMRSLLEVIKEPDTQGRLFLQLDGDRLQARLNDRVLDYTTPARFSSEVGNKLTVLNVVFEGGECPVDPCENAIDVVD